jgi:hypothetical protein
LTSDRGPTIIRAGDGWTAVGERFAAGGPTVAEALAKYWEIAKASNDESVLWQEAREAQ